jgi:uncharacterized membrane protein required for colicin V production
MDLAIIGSFAAGIFFGFQQGMLRYILSTVGILVSFALASQLKSPITSALSFWEYGLPEQRELWIYLLLVAAGFAGSWFLVRAFYRTTRLPIVRQLDEFGGAVAGALWVGLLWSFTVVAMDSFFTVASQADLGAVTFLGPIYDALNDSVIVSWFRESVVPVAGFLIRPFVPEEIRVLLLP